MKVLNKSIVAIAFVFISTLSLAISLFDQNYTKTCRSPLSVPKNELDCKLRADSGDPIAQYQLAEYKSAEGQTPVAEALYKLSALQGHDEAIEHVRIEMIQEAARTSSSKALIEFLRKVTEVKGIDNRTLWVTQAQICDIYANPKGLGISEAPNFKPAVYWCEQSSKNGGSKAAWEVIRFHKLGLGVPKSSKKAEALWQEFLARDVMPIAQDHPESVIQWQEEAAALGICTAMKQLSEISEKGLYRVIPSVDKSAAWKRKYESCKTAD